MDQATALAQLTANVAANTKPVLDATALSRLLALAAVPDSAGHAVDDPAWVPTYSDRGLRKASAQGWREKAGLVSDQYDVGVGSGVTFDRSQLISFCLDMAKQYGGRGGGGASVALIGSSNVNG